MKYAFPYAKSTIKQRRLITGLCMYLEKEIPDFSKLNKGNASKLIVKLNKELDISLEEWVKTYLDKLLSDESVNP